MKTRRMESLPTFLSDSWQLVGLQESLAGVRRIPLMSPKLEFSQVCFCYFVACQCHTIVTLSIAENQSNPAYNGMIRTLRTMHRQSGFSVFFSGLGATTVRAFPTNACTFYTVLWVKKYLDGY